MRRRRALALLAQAAALGAITAACADSTSEPAHPPGPGEVEATRLALDERADRAPSSVTSWGIDPADGLVLVTVAGPRDAAVDDFLAGLDPRTLRVETGSPPIRLFPGPPD